MSRVKTQLNHFFNYLMDEEIIGHNPTDRIKFKRNLPPKRPRVILSKGEIKHLVNELKVFSPNVLYPFIYAIVHTGARRGEIQKLTWDNVDFKTQFIHLRKTKNGEDRRVKMSPKFLTLLENKARISSYVFTNREGNKINRGTLHRLLKKFKQKHPIGKDWRYHVLRHSFAYNFLKNKGEMYQLKAILGHKSIQMTIDLYGNLKSADIENPSPFDF